MRRDQAGVDGVTSVLTGEGAGADGGGAVACTRTRGRTQRTKVTQTRVEPQFMQNKHTKRSIKLYVKHL